jgi:hypothetical protein
MTQPADPFAPAGAVQTTDFATAAQIGEHGWAETSTSRVMPHPITGELTTFQRASKMGGVLADPYILRQWEKAMVAFGIGLREDLFALAASEPRPGPHHERPTYWWKPWETYAGQAIDAAEGKRGAHLGTAIHRFTEQHDAGTLKWSEIPSRWQPHVRKYEEMHEALGLKIETIETMIVRLDLHIGVCGRLDRLRRCPDGRLIVDDLKTGRNAPMGLDEIAIQLAIYANAEWIFDPVTMAYLPMPEEVRKDVALVSWVPVDNPDAGEVIPVDIEWGWRAAQVVAWVLEYRNAAKRTGARKKGLRLPLSAIFDGAGDPVVPQDYAARIEAAGSLEELSGIYLEAYPAGFWTVELQEQAQRRKDEIRGERPALRLVEI